MAPVVEERQEPSIKPRQRPDRKDHGEHHEGAAAESANAQVDRGRHILRRIDPIGNDEKDADEQRNRRHQDGIVDDLGAVPLDGAKTNAHRTTSECGAGGGGGRQMSASATPKPIVRANTGHSARCKDRCERLILRPPYGACRDESQRASTSGHNAVAPGNSRIRAPIVTGAGCTRATPTTTNASPTSNPITT